MREFKDYANNYSHIQMKRQDGILEITFHSDGKTSSSGAAGRTDNSDRPSTTSPRTGRTNSSS